MAFFHRRMTDPVVESDGRAGVWTGSAAASPLRYRSWVAWTCLATLAFWRPLVALVEHASTHELLSYIPLVPFISIALIHAHRDSLPRQRQISAGPALVLGVVSAAAVWASLSARGRLSVNDHLALTTLAYVCLVLAGGFVSAGRTWMAAAAFPIGFLLFLVPPPDAMAHAIEHVSVLGSAEVSAWLFRLTGTPLVRDGTVFVIPGITLEVARECSGINSSWTLFIVSLVSSNLLLKTTWRRVGLVALVAPLAILRNSLRILTVGLLCVHVGPHMIDSYIHRSGGPIFFALSLIPLFLALVWLRRIPR